MDGGALAPATSAPITASSQDAQNPWGTPSQTLRLASYESLNGDSKATPSQPRINPSQSPAFLKRQGSLVVPPAAADPSPPARSVLPADAGQKEMLSLGVRKRSRQDVEGGADSPGSLAPWT